MNAKKNFFNECYNYVGYKCAFFINESFLKSGKWIILYQHMCMSIKTCKTVKCFKQTELHLSSVFQLYVRNLTPCKCILNFCCSKKKKIIRENLWQLQYIHRELTIIICITYGDS